MKITYDPEVDMMYIQFNDKQPAGATPLTEQIYAYTTEADELVGIELFAVSTFAGSVEGLAAQFEPPLVEEDEASVQ